MKKTLLTLLLIISTSLCLAFGLTACGDGSTPGGSATIPGGKVPDGNTEVEKHEHVWEWNNDEYEHWQQCTVKGCTEEQDRYPHIDKDEDGKCDTCGYSMENAKTAVESVTLSETSLTLTVNKTATLTATVAPDDAYDKTVTWSVSPAGIVTVSDGVITAVAEGEATVTATAGSKTATCTVKVIQPAPSQLAGRTYEFYDVICSANYPANMVDTVRNSMEGQKIELFDDGTYASGVTGGDVQYGTYEESDGTVTFSNASGQQAVYTYEGSEMSIVVRLTGYTFTYVFRFYAEPHDHVWDSNWEYDETYHWHVCTVLGCYELGSYSEHVFIDGFCVCGQHEHVWSALQSDGTHHWRECTVDGCDAINGYEEHDFSDGDCACGISAVVYELSEDGESYLVSGLVNATAVTADIASVYNGKPVTGVIDYAFNNKTSYDALTTIIIPDSITYIGAYAFYGLENLQYNEYENCLYLGNENNPYVLLMSVKDTEVTQATIHENTKFIGDYAFDGCTQLTEIIIPSNVLSIGNYAFSGCSELTDVTISDGVLNICNYAFSGCSKLTDLIIPDSVLSIEYYAFSGCSSLTNVTLPDGLTSLGINVFNNCNNLQYNEYENGLYLGNDNNPYLVLCGVIDKTQSSFTIYDGTEFIGSNAFYQYTALTQITIPDSVTSIGYSAFRYCSGLTSIVIPDSVTSIGNAAFDSCGGLTSITLSKSLTIIDWYTFRYCNGLTDVIIPDSVTVIGAYAFCRCANLTSITLGKSVITIEEYAFEYCNNLVSVNCGESLKTIEWAAFNSCDGLKEITLPATLETITTGAFMSCGELTDIYYNGTIEQWNAVTKMVSWNYSTGKYTVHCTDGDVAK